MNVQTFALVIFVLGYIIITFEHRLKTQKAPVALLLGVLLWALVPLSGVVSLNQLEQSLESSAAETFNIVVFLLTAMTLIEVLVHYRFFDMIRKKLYNLGLQDQGQFVIFSLMTFFLSAILDNLTTTLVMINIARRFFKGRNLILVSAAIVVNANAGGAWSPIGDVTTIMLWLANKFTASEVFKDVFLASATHATVASFLLMRQLTRDTEDSVEDLELNGFKHSELAVISITLISFLFPLGASQMGIPPYMGLLAGLALVWTLTGFLKEITNHQSHLDADIAEMTKRVDMPSLQFFIGILIAIGALHTMGILETVSSFLFGEMPTGFRIYIGNTILGWLSSIVDNVPLTALAMEVVPTTNPVLWTFLAYCVGTGGSHLVIGSAAGVVAMGLVKELNSLTYLQVATRPVAIAYLAGIVVFALQQLLT